MKWLTFFINDEIIVIINNSVTIIKNISRKIKIVTDDE